MLETLNIDPRLKLSKDSVRDLLTTPRVVRVNSFDEEAVKSFSTAMSAAHQTGQPVIPIVIDTDGGDPYSLLAMVDIIGASEVPVATIVEGKAFSCGAVLFCCGAQGLRFMGPNSTLMIHDVLSGSEEYKKTREVVADAHETSRLNKRLYRVIDKGIGKPVNYTWDIVQKRTRTDWYLNPKDAVRLGYASHAKLPILRCQVKVEVELSF